MKNTLNKKERLKSETNIKKVFQSKQRFISFPIRVNYDSASRVDDEESIKVLIGCSKKGIKRAVDRNRIKRLMREVYRTNKQGLISYANLNNKKLGLSLIYIGNEIPDFEFINIKMNEVMSRLLRQLENTNLDENIKK